MTKPVVLLIVAALPATLYIAGVFHHAEKEHLTIQHYKPTPQDVAASHGFDNAANEMKQHKDR